MVRGPLRRRLAPHQLFLPKTAHGQKGHHGMIDSKNWVALLKQKKFNFFTGVPCSFFKSAINAVLDDGSLRYVMVPNEGAGLAVAAGAALAGERPIVMIQNSGLGNLINPLTS